MFLDIFFCNNIKCSLSHRVQFFKDPSAAYSANIWEFYQRYDKSYWFVPRTVILNVLKLKRDFHEFRLLKGEWFLLPNVELEPILFTVVTISLTKNDKLFPCMSSFTPRFCTHVDILMLICLCWFSCYRLSRWCLSYSPLFSYRIMFGPFSSFTILSSKS